MSDPAPASAAKIQMYSAAPTFLVADVGYTARWYQEQLGFELAGSFPDKEPFAYASLRSDAVEIILLSLNDYQKRDLRALRPEGLWDAYVRMQGVHPYYEKLKHQPFITSPLTQQGYGDWEFEVQDPNGYIVVFSEFIE